MEEYDTPPVTSESTDAEPIKLVHASECTDGETVEPVQKDNGLPYPESRGVFRIKFY